MYDPFLHLRIRRPRVDVTQECRVVASLTQPKDRLSSQLGLDVLAQSIVAQNLAGALAPGLRQREERLLLQLRLARAGQYALQSIHRSLARDL